MLTILDAIEKGNEHRAMHLDHSDDEVLSDSSDDDIGVVFSPRPMRRASSASDLKLNAPQATLRPSNSMINLPRAYVRQLFVVLPQ